VIHIVGRMRCAYCHASLHASLARSCAGCHTQVHPECAADLRACPTLGCDIAWSGDASRAAPRLLGPWTRRSWILCGAALPALAFLVDLYLRVDPLVWGAPSLLGPNEIALGVRAPVTWALAMVSVGGLLAWLLRGRAAWSRWGIGVGVGVALAHAVMFLPLLPLSLFGLIYFGLGTLGLLPFVTVWIYAAALRRAQLQAVAELKLGAPSRGPWWAALAAAVVVLGVHAAAPIHLDLAAPAAPRYEQIGEAKLRAGIRELLADAKDKGDYWTPDQLPPSLTEFAADARVTVSDAWVEFQWDDHSAVPYGYSLFVRREGWTILPSHGTCYRYVELAPAIWSGWFAKTPPPGPGPAYVNLSGGSTLRGGWIGPRR